MTSRVESSTNYVKFYGQNESDSFFITDVKCYVPKREFFIPVRTGVY